MAENNEPELGELDAELDEIKDAIREAENQCKIKENLNKRKTNLEKKTGEVRQVLTAYGKVLQNFKDTNAELESFSEEAGSAIEGAIGDKKEIIDGKISEYKTELVEMEREVSTLRSTFNDAIDNYNTAIDNHEDAQKKYNKWKTRQATIREKLDGIKRLKDKVEKEAETRIGIKYFLMQDLDTELKKLGIEPEKIVAQEELNTALQAAVKNLSNTEKVLQDKEKAKNTAESEYESRKTELELFKENRREKIIEKIRTLYT